MRTKPFVTEPLMRLVFGICLSCLVLAVLACPVPAVQAQSPGAREDVSTEPASQVPLTPGHQAAAAGGEKSAAGLTPEERLNQVEETLRSIKTTGERSEVRSYENKMMARELIRYVKWVVAVLLGIGVGFPILLWVLSRRRVLGSSPFSPDIVDTLVAVEERQAKLANILREIQGEIDYLHSMSVPDLKKLIDQAERYIKQNEKELEKAGLGGRKSGPGRTPTAEEADKAS